MTLNGLSYIDYLNCYLLCWCACSFVDGDVLVAAAAAESASAVVAAAGCGAAVVVDYANLNGDYCYLHDASDLIAD